MKKRNFVKTKNWIWKLCIGLGLFMIALVLSSAVYFGYKIRESSEIVNSLEYNTYDDYYVMITDDRKNDFWQSAYQGACVKAAEGGVYVEMLGENINADYGKEDLMDIAINSKVDGIIVEADESETMEEKIRQAQNAGIPVVTALYDNPDSERQSHIGVNSYNLGREYGNQICHIAADKGMEKYSVLVLLSAEKKDNSQNIVISAIREMIQMQNMEHKIQVETAQVENNSMFAAEESIRDIFMQSEVLPDIIVCLNEENTTCAYQAVVDYNRVGQVEIVGYYESDTILSAIEKRVIHSTISIDATQLGMYCIEALNEYRESGRSSDYYDVDVSLITAETMATPGEGGAP